MRLRQRHDLRAVGIDLDPRRRRARCGSREPIETGVLSINSNTSVRVTTPFGGFKQSRLRRASSARMRSTRTPRSSRSTTPTR